MAVSDSLHSQFVSWSKILLPLAGIALLSSLFLFARAQGPDPTIPFADIEQIARDAGISAPRFTGVTLSGATIEISAEGIIPDPTQPDAFAVTEIRTQIVSATGGEILVTAGMGTVDPRAQVARLTGLARLTASGGYVMETQGLLANIETGRLTSLGGLDVQTPFGTLSAGGLEVTVPPGGRGQRMVFNQGVRLLYIPQPQRSAP